MNTTTAHGEWNIETRILPYQSGRGPGTHAGVGAGMGKPWLTTTLEALPAGGGHLDLGCGSGRMTFALKERWSPGGWSAGADRDESSIIKARQRADEENLPSAEFHLLDIEKENYTTILAGRTPDLITAHLCMGLEIVERAAAVLPPGGTFACVALHAALWSEVGFTSRFALSEASVEAMLKSFHLIPTFLRVEKRIVEFSSEREAIEEYFQNGEKAPGWKNDGRWEAVRRYIAEGGRTLTAAAQLQCIARRTAS
jgi:SAM-dependent methyltransferase